MLTEGQTIFRAQHSLKSSDEVEWEKLTETQACAALLTHDRLLTRYSQPTARHVVRAVENSGQGYLRCKLSVCVAACVAARKRGQA